MKAQTDKDGKLRIGLPARFANKKLEIVLVFSVEGEAEALDENGYPVGLLEATYDVSVDTPLEILYDPPIIASETVEN